MLLSPYQTHVTLFHISFQYNWRTFYLCCHKCLSNLPRPSTPRERPRYWLSNITFTRHDVLIKMIKARFVNNLIGNFNVKSILTSNLFFHSARDQLFLISFFFSSKLLIVGIHFHHEQLTSSFWSHLFPFVSHLSMSWVIWHHLEHFDRSVWFNRSATIVTCNSINFFFWTLNK